MLDFFEISSGFRVAFLAVIFTVVFVAVFFLIYLSRSEKNTFAKISVAFFSILDTVILIIYSSGMYYFFYSNPLNEKTKEFMTIPIVFISIPVILLFAEIVYLGTRELHNRKQSITSNSIKESFDNLPTGLCFSLPDGRIQLFNHTMSELCYTITDAELQNADSFWKTLANGYVSRNVKRLSSGENPEFRLPDGSIWLFRKNKLDDEKIQITATDITQFHNLTQRLREKNIVLSDMNERLRKYGENADELTRSRERLETKERIHNNLGQALLATRHSLNNENGDLSSVMELWKRNISVLKTGATNNDEEYTLNTLFEAAFSAGITIDLSGELPDNNEIRKLFVVAATEALTNAVRHAKAKTLYIGFSHCADNYSVRFTNDGIPPAKEITEGGGMGNLRKRVERMNGQMRVISKPRYALEITIDAKADDSDVECTYS